MGLNCCKRPHKKGLAFALACAAGLGGAQSANAIIFAFTPAAGMSQQSIDGFNAAARRWSSLFSDPCTININIDFHDLGGTILGQTSITRFSTTYKKVYAAVQTDARTADDTSAFNALQTLNATTDTGVKMLLNRTSDSPNGNGSATPYLDKNNTTNNINVYFPTANGRALNLYPTTFPTSDAGISFSSAYQWDFDPSNGIDAGKYDFVGIAAHELGHALGFSSNVDFLDVAYNSSNPPTYAAEATTTPSMMDLFRFSTESKNLGTGIIDVSADTRDKYFSIDGGATKLASYSTGVYFGDGRQNSHWKDNQNLGIMDPTAAAGEQLLISPNDKRLMDVIGWNPTTMWSWINTNGANFNSGVGWNTSLTPGPSENAVFDLTNTYSVGFVADANVANSYFRGGTVTFNLGTYSYTTGAMNLGENSAENATVTLNGGSLAATQVLIGRSAGGSTAKLTLSGNITANTTTGITVYSGGSLVLAGATVSGGAITLSGGSLSANGGSSTINSSVPGLTTFQVDAGSLTLNSAFTSANNATLTKLGAGAMTLAGTQTHGTLTKLIVSAGTMNLNTNAGSTTTANLQVDSAATTNFNSTENLRALNITGGTTTLTAAAGARTLKTPALSIANGKLDLADNKLIVSGSNLSAITAQVLAGRNGGAWNGNGIVTAMSNASPAIGLRTLAVATASSVGKSSFGGMSVAGSDVLVMYTWAGDVNLDGIVNGDDYFKVDTLQNGPPTGDINNSGKVDADDYFILNRNYNRNVKNGGRASGDLNLDGNIDSADFLAMDMSAQGISLATYGEGDFNYDGWRDADDYFLLDRSYARQLTAGSELPDVVIGEDGTTSVPEPVTALPLLGTAALLRRRRSAKLAR